MTLAVMIFSVCLPDRAQTSPDCMLRSVWRSRAARRAAEALREAEQRKRETHKRAQQRRRKAAKPWKPQSPNQRRSAREDAAAWRRKPLSASARRISESYCAATISADLGSAPVPTDCNADLFGFAPVEGREVVVGKIAVQS